MGGALRRLNTKDSTKQCLPQRLEPRPMGCVVLYWDLVKILFGFAVVKNSCEGIKTYLLSWFVEL